MPHQVQEAHSLPRTQVMDASFRRVRAERGLGCEGEQVRTVCTQREGMNVQS